MIQLTNAALFLEDGTYFNGHILNEIDNQEGEICFNTGMTGYQEVITDPSYTNQIIVFSFPHIGNVGANKCDNESEKAFVNGIVLGDLPTSPTNHRHEESFSNWLREKNVGGICGVDTRSLIKKISSSQDPIKGKIKRIVNNGYKQNYENYKNELNAIKPLSGSNLSSMTSTRRNYIWETAELSISKIYSPGLPFKIGVIDFGVKQNILRCLISRGCIVEVFPEDVTYQALMNSGVQGIILSNGPGDPRFMKERIITTLTELISAHVPILGICLGYQILAHIYKANIYQMSCGHHGINHPVKDLETQRVIITSQNHEFVVDLGTLPKILNPTHISLFDHSLEGFKVEDKPIVAVQFHPEASPGPHDAMYVIDNFIELVSQNA